MGTRGAYGFKKGNVMKITYNHYDSYYEVLGREVMKFVSNTTNEELNKIFDKIIMVDENTIPTQEQIKECEKYADLSVSNKTEEDWYCLLRETQGDLSAYKEGLKYMIDNKEFMGDSLFCEYAYIINLDNNNLEIYEGFNQEKETNNDYTIFRKQDEKYVEVKLVDTIPFEKLREEGFIDTYIKTLGINVQEVEDLILNKNFTLESLESTINKYMEENKYDMDKWGVSAFFDSEKNDNICLGISNEEKDKHYRFDVTFITFQQCEDGTFVVKDVYLA